MDKSMYTKVYPSVVDLIELPTFLRTMASQDHQLCFVSFTIQICQKAYFVSQVNLNDLCPSHVLNKLKMLSNLELSL